MACAMVKNAYPTLIYDEGVMLSAEGRNNVAMLYISRDKSSYESKPRYTRLIW